MPAGRRRAAAPGRVPRRSWRAGRRWSSSSPRRRVARPAARPAVRGHRVRRGGRRCRSSPRAPGWSRATRRRTGRPTAASESSVPLHGRGDARARPRPASRRTASASQRSPARAGSCITARLAEVTSPPVSSAPCITAARRAASSRTRPMRCSQASGAGSSPPSSVARAARLAASSVGRPGRNSGSTGKSSPSSTRRRSVCNFTAAGAVVALPAEAASACWRASRFASSATTALHCARSAARSAAASLAAPGGARQGVVQAEGGRGRQGAAQRRGAGAGLRLQRAQAGERGAEGVGHGWRALRQFGWFGAVAGRHVGGQRQVLGGGRALAGDQRVDPLQQRAQGTEAERASHRRGRVEQLDLGVGRRRGHECGEGEQHARVELARRRRCALPREAITSDSGDRPSAGSATFSAFTVLPARTFAAKHEARRAAEQPRDPRVQARFGAAAHVSAERGPGRGQHRIADQHQQPLRVRGAAARRAHEVERRRALLPVERREHRAGAFVVAEHVLMHRFGHHQVGHRVVQVGEAVQLVGEQRQVGRVGGTARGARTAWPALVAPALAAAPRRRPRRAPRSSRRARRRRRCVSPVGRSGNSSRSGRMYFASSQAARRAARVRCGSRAARRAAGRAATPSSSSQRGARGRSCRSRSAGPGARRRGARGGRCAAPRPSRPAPATARARSPASSPAASRRAAGRRASRRRRRARRPAARVRTVARRRCASEVNQASSRYA